MLNERGVYLRLISLDHWGISDERTTWMPPGIPILLNLPYATSDRDDFSSFVTQEDLMSDLLRNIPPEHVRRCSGMHDPAVSDVYTLAATAYEAFTSHPCLHIPNHRDDGEYSYSTFLLERVHAVLTSDVLAPSRHCAEIPPILGAILLKALSKDPSSRYVSCRSLAHDLDKLRKLLLANHKGENLTMRVGAGDRQYRLQTTNELYGCAHIEESLRRSLSQATHRSSSLVTMEGQSGTGKTAVITRTLLPLINEQNGLWVSVKAQIHAQHTFSIVAEMLNAFLRPLLLIPHLDATKCKTMVAEALGDGPMLIMVADVDRDLRAPFGFPDPLTGEDAEPNALRRTACQAALIRLIQRVAQELKPVVILIDDCQWLPDSDVSFLKLLVEGVKHAPLPVMIVCAYRPEDDNDEAQRAFHNTLSPLLITATHLKLGPLNDEASFAMIADALGPPREGNEELSEERHMHTVTVQSFMRQSSSLVPMFIRQMLVTMRDRRILTFDWSVEAWSFDAVQAMRVGEDWRSGDSAQFLRGTVLSQLPMGIQDLLVAASTLSGAGPFSADMLAVVLDRPPAELMPLLSLLVQRQILNTVNAANDASDSSTILSFSVSSVSHQFSHDQWIEASYALCPVSKRANLYYTQAIRLDAQAIRRDVLVAMNLVRAHELGKAVFR
jgi:hypothetical protein